MKKIGLVGGIGPASTVDYYLGLINKCRAENSDDTYPEIVIDSINMHDMIKAFSENDCQTVCNMITESISSLKAAGAEIAAITSNTPHIIWDMIKDRLDVNTLSIVDCAVNYIKEKGFRRVLILGTEFTMKSGMYEKAFTENGITPIVPDSSDISVIAALIYPNLENGIVIPDDKVQMISAAEKYITSQSADAVLLGCTEIPLMIKEHDLSVPVIDTTSVHVSALYEAAKE